MTILYLGEDNDSREKAILVDHTNKWYQVFNYDYEKCECEIPSDKYWLADIVIEDLKSYTLEELETLCKEYERREA